MQRTDQLFADLEYLEMSGLTLAQLRSMRHGSDRPEANERVPFSSVRDYFSCGRGMRSNNAAIADRLHTVSDLHRHGMAGLVEISLHKHPL